MKLTMLAAEYSFWIIFGFGFIAALVWGVFQAPPPKCPHCMKEVEKGATRCPYCTSDL